MEKLTLITITYNRIDHFKKLLESLRNQTKLPDELIVSDDGSKNKDEILKLLKEEKQILKGMRIKFIDQDDLGFRLSRARNNGVRESSSELLLIVDSDIIMPPKFIEIFYKNSKKKQALLSRSIRLSEESTQLITKEEINNQDLKKYYTFKDIWKNIERFYRDIIYYHFNPRRTASKFRTMAFCIYKEDYIKINGFDEKFIGWGSEDVEFGYRLYLNGIKIKNSHKNNFQLHQWHKNFEEGNQEEEDYKMFLEEKRHKNTLTDSDLPEYGYLKTYNNDKYRVVEIW